MNNPQNQDVYIEKSGPTKLRKNKKDIPRWAKKTIGLALGLTMLGGIFAFIAVAITNLVA